MAEGLPVLYLCGPMSGLPAFNYPAFHAAAGKLRAAGYEVLNPAENQLEGSPSWQDYMRAAIGQVVKADALAVLPGYQASRGAAIETKLAWDLDMRVRPVRYWLTLQGQQAYMGRLLDLETKAEV
ncbi:deoxycytidylate deaminase [Arthrobacter phage LittleTokyo]|nr:deoxycytidylate deaminase [Arthrobacter phage LittleTokyo]